MDSNHEMPFGAQRLPDGATRFRLWAPAARTVDLCFEGTDADTVLPMEPEGDGWFRREVRSAPSGALYRYRIDGDLRVPDPASRFQPRDVHGPSELIDPGAWVWDDRTWTGRPWEEVVFYEAHVGAATSEGTFVGLQGRLDHLASLGVTALELMPVSDFPGRRNWGYDGVLPFAPDGAYGRPEELKALIQAAHGRGIMVFLDVVYNHFGPEGNLLSRYAPAFFSARHTTPWGPAINFDGEGSRWVRSFFIHNALYWLEEFRFDGLRLDAVHAIVDDSTPHFLDELASAVREGPGRERHVHLVLENNDNEARRLERDAEGRPQTYVAQWNDDIHHALHVLTTGETDGYYEDYADDPVRHLARCLSEGFAYQGERSGYSGDARRGEPSDHLPPTAFVSFIQNHDQVGNRAFGERLTTLAPAEPLRVATTILLLAPSPPLLFMGEEWGATTPFPFFCDLGPELAARVTEGRRSEFAKFPRFSEPQSRERIPDPMAEATFESARLDRGTRGDGSGAGRSAAAGTADAPASPEATLERHRNLLAIRHRELVPRLAGAPGGSAGHTRLAERAVSVHWRLGDGSRWTLVANLGGEAFDAGRAPIGRLVYSTEPVSERIPRWFAAWYVQEED